jgi:hypothetical protein
MLLPSGCCSDGSTSFGCLSEKSGIATRSWKIAYSHRYCLVPLSHSLSMPSSLSSWLMPRVWDYPYKLIQRLTAATPAASAVLH